MWCLASVDFSFFKSISCFVFVPCFLEPSLPEVTGCYSPSFLLLILFWTCHTLNPLSLWWRPFNVFVCFSVRHAVLVHLSKNRTALMTVAIMYNQKQSIEFQTDIEGIWWLMRTAVVDFDEHMSMYFSFLWSYLYGVFQFTFNQQKKNLDCKLSRVMYSQVIMSTSCHPL